MVSLPSIASIAVSGMHAAQTQLQASAHNVANLATSDFRRVEVAQEAVSPGYGVSAVMTRSGTTGADLTADMVGQLQAKHSFYANLSVFKTSDRMAGMLLDTTA